MPPRTTPLPADDPDLATLTLDELELRWAAAAARTAITAEAMTGADLKAQALGVPGEALMEHAGTAVAAAARALVAFNGREGRPVLVLAGPGNNGGDGFVAARRLAEWGTPVIAVLVAADESPGTHDAHRNWKRLDGIDGVTKIHAAGRAGRRHPGPGHREGRDHRGRAPGHRRPRPAPRARPHRGRDHPQGPRGRHPGARRRHAHRRGPHLGRPVRSGRARRPHGDLPPPEDRACKRAWDVRSPGASSSPRSASRPRRTGAEA